MVDLSGNSFLLKANDGIGLAGEEERNKAGASCKTIPAWIFSNRGHITLQCKDLSEF